MNEFKSENQHPPSETIGDRVSSAPVQLELFPRAFGGTAWLPESPVERTPSREFCLPSLTPSAATTADAGDQLALHTSEETFVGPIKPDAPSSAASDINAAIEGWRLGGVK
jgi:hypothetical protein